MRKFVKRFKVIISIILFLTFITGGSIFYLTGCTSRAEAEEECCEECCEKCDWDQDCDCDIIESSGSLCSASAECECICY